MALVSGRPLRDLDRLFAPQQFLAAGVHGAELRLSAGVERRVAVDTSALDQVRQAFRGFVLDHPGTLVEDKGLAVSLHFRRRVDAARDAHQLAVRLSERLGPDFQVLEGKMVVEIRPMGATKGAAVEAFLRCASFAERRPVYVGDDITDEDAFRAVNDVGGISVVVGASEPTAATRRLADVAAVHRWLCAVIAHLETPDGHV
jgi:trehalose 6-phosphate phosphatase